MKRLSFGHKGGHIFTDTERKDIKIIVFIDKFMMVASDKLRHFHVI